jgi:hypothetical protein
MIEFDIFSHCIVVFKFDKAIAKPNIFYHLATIILMYGAVLW